jgi:glycosyltransferase involved in cell wall biosynthesis
MNKIRVLHFAELVNKNDFVDSIVRSLDKSIFEVYVCTYTKRVNIASPEYEEIGIEHIALDISSRTEYPVAILKLIKIIKQKEIDILHTHLFDEAFIGAIVRSFIPKLKFVLGRHYSDELYQTAKGLQLKKSLSLEFVANSKADRIIAASSFIKNLLIKQNVNEEKICRINYGFDFSSERYLPASLQQNTITRQELGIDNEQFVIANVGRHYFLKGQVFLIEAFAEFSKVVPNCCLLMIGDGPERSKLQNLADKLSVKEKVIFTGWRKDGSKLISASNVVVHPTLTEAFPQIMIETMALSKLLVITNVSGPCDQVKHLETGYIIEKKSAESIYNSLIWAYNEPNKAEEIGRAARNYVLSNLDVKDVVKDYELVYQNLKA